MTVELNKNLGGIEDLLSSDSTATVTQQRLGPDGTVGNVAVTPVNSASLMLSAPAKTALGLSGNAKIDNALTYLAASSGLSAATTTTQGKVKVDANMAGDPVALTTGGTLAGRIPTTDQDAALDAALNPNGANEFVTMQRLDRTVALMLGSGKDGFGQFGTISGTPAAPTLVDAGAIANSLNAGTYYYVIQAYNLSGQGNPSSPSAAITVASGRGVTLTLPSLPANSMGWRIYRSTDAVNYYYVGQAVNGWNYFPSASQTYTDTVTYANTSLTPPAASSGSTATMSGRYEFITLDLTNATTITVATSGNYTGLLDIRVQGLFTPASGCTINATGAQRNTVRSRFRNARSTGMTIEDVYFVNVPNNTIGSGAGLGPLGLGTEYGFLGFNYAGYGSQGESNTAGGGIGGFGGGHIRILCYQIAGNSLIGTYNAIGQAGGNGTSAAGYQYGGGGGAGGIVDVRSVVPWRSAATISAAGGAGGNSTGTGGAQTITGAPGGGGGLVVLGNCFDTSAGTPSVAAGANGTGVSTANGASTGAGSWSGGHYGAGGKATFSAAVTAGTLGQVLTLNGFYDPSVVHLGA